jgi:hypothetical protein
LLKKGGGGYLFYHRMLMEHMVWLLDRAAVAYIPVVNERVFTEKRRSSKL